jgi:nucleoid-associated protein EbfC
MPKQMKDFLKQAQRMQRDMMKMQEELGSQEFEGTAGGGQVAVKVNGHGDVTALSIKKEVVDPNDVEMLEDLIIAAIRSAKEKANEASQSKLSGVTGGMNIPGLI